MKDDNKQSISDGEARLAKYFSYNYSVETNQNLTDLDKLIFGRILYFILFGEEGRCYASNQSFADHFSKSIPSISKSISRLITAGIVKIQSAGRNRGMIINFDYFNQQAEITPEEDKIKLDDDPYRKLKPLKVSLIVNDNSDDTHKVFLKQNINKIISNNNINMQTLKENFKGADNIFLFSDKSEKELYIIVSEIFAELENYKWEDIKKAILQVIRKSEVYYRMIQAGIQDPAKYKQFLLEATEKRLQHQQVTKISQEEQISQKLPESQVEFLNGIVSEIRRITLKNLGHKQDKESPSNTLTDNPQDSHPGETIATFTPLLTMELAPEQKLSVVIEGTLETIRISKNKYKMTSSFGNLILIDTEGTKIHIQVNELLFGKYRMQLLQARGERIKLNGDLYFNKYYKKNSIRAVKFLSIGSEEMND